MSISTTILLVFRASRAVSGATQPISKLNMAWVGPRSLSWISFLSVGCVGPGSVCFSGTAVVVAVVDVGFLVVDVVVG